jgi:hypothetical protein
MSRLLDEIFADPQVETLMRRLQQARQEANHEGTKDTKTARRTS